MEKNRVKINSYLLSGAVLGISLGTACASRAVPSTFPSTSPASTLASEAAVISVVAALEEEPPLPGEAIDRWPGLRPVDAPPGGGHEHHQHQHQQHDAPRGRADASGEAPRAAPGEGKAPVAPTYTCPMHEDVVTDRPGRCPHCGMTLERRP
jgi:hypothetical protein